MTDLKEVQGALAAINEAVRHGIAGDEINKRHLNIKDLQSTTSVSLNITSAQ
ncbi:hypothetical protein N9E48_01755 [Paracoccaceae bacterium]|nr:hypothetical protein [Paracoccaceae bacterium]